MDSETLSHTILLLRLVHFKRRIARIEADSGRSGIRVFLARIQKLLEEAVLRVAEKQITAEILPTTESGEYLISLTRPSGAYLFAWVVQALAIRENEKRLGASSETPVEDWFVAGAATHPASTKFDTQSQNLLVDTKLARFLGHAAPGQLITDEETYQKIADPVVKRKFTLIPSRRSAGARKNLYRSVLHEHGSPPQRSHPRWLIPVWGAVGILVLVVLLVVNPTGHRNTPRPSEPEAPPVTVPSTPAKKSVPPQPPPPTYPALPTNWLHLRVEAKKFSTVKESALLTQELESIERELREVDLVLDDSPNLAQWVREERRKNDFLALQRSYVSEKFLPPMGSESTSLELNWEKSSMGVVIFLLEETSRGFCRKTARFSSDPAKRFLLFKMPKPFSPTQPLRLVVLCFPVDEDTAVALRNSSSAPFVLK